jgi:hypothetical protein
MKKLIHCLLCLGTQVGCLLFVTSCDPSRPILSKEEAPQASSEIQKPDALDEARFRKERWTYRYRGLGKLTGKDLVLYQEKDSGDRGKNPAQTSSEIPATKNNPSSSETLSAQSLEKPVISNLGSQFSADLWQGCLKALNSFPLEIIDGEKGMLQTAVYAPKPNERLQIRIHLFPGDATYSNFQVSIIRHVLENNQWVLKGASPSFERSLKRDILLHARVYAARSRSLISSS